MVKQVREFIYSRVQSKLCKQQREQVRLTVSELSLPLWTICIWLLLSYKTKLNVKNMICNHFPTLRTMVGRTSLLSLCLYLCLSSVPFCVHPLSLNNRCLQFSLSLSWICTVIIFKFFWRKSYKFPSKAPVKYQLINTVQLGSTKYYSRILFYQLTYSNEWLIVS